MSIQSNRLAFETSPYLLQHAHNPVDWYPWGEEALNRAKQENKPILVSIGYAACHWCHVMERESFEDKETSELMNNNFVCIKIDREERPDLDHIYMDAVQAMTGSGGWPLNVFLTPESKPFYGGTYYPPRPAFNRPSWKDVLISIATAFKEKRNEINAQAENLTEHLFNAGQFVQREKNKDEKLLRDFFAKNTLEQMFQNIMKTADREKGGFGRAPKFPQTFIIQFLLRHYYFTKNEEALAQACLSLDKMIAGGIFDQLGGGFARYSTDDEWLAPHFEKMLYDNALFVSVLCDAFLITKKENYRKAIIETIGFVERELKDDNNGFYAALDADSEGEEGKFYVWGKIEIDKLLGADAPVFCKYFDITEQGNWEGKNILRCNKKLEEFAIENEIESNKLLELLEKCKQKLLSERAKRARPALDYKIILSWNALMNIALSKAYGAIGDEHYKNLAIANMDFLLENLKGEGPHLFFHTYASGQAKFPAFLDDYAFLIAALIQLQEISCEEKYLLEAKKITEYLIRNFSDNGENTFYFTHKDQKDIILRKKEIYDGALPSGNSLMVLNLLQLSIVFEIPEWKEWAINNCFTLEKIIKNHCSSFAVWATFVQAVTYGILEVVITGKNSSALVGTRKEFLNTFIPFKVYQSATQETPNFPLLINKPILERPLIFLCQNYKCELPVSEIVEFEREISKIVEKL